MAEITIVVLFLVLFTIDWMQTLTIAKNPDKYEEQFNPFLRGHPSVKRVNLVFSAFLALICLTAYSMPEAWAFRFLFCWVIVEAAMVVNNYMEGIKP